MRAPKDPGGAQRGSSDHDSGTSRDPHELDRVVGLGHIAVSNHGDLRHGLDDLADRVPVGLA